MVCLEMLALIVEIAVSKVRGIIHIVRCQRELAAKKEKTNKVFGEIGELAQYLRDGSSQFQNLQTQVEQTAATASKIKGQIRAVKAQREALQVELKQIRKGILDASPRVASLERQLKTLPNSGSAVRQNRILESDLKSQWINLGRQAFAERAQVGILRTHYHSAQTLLDQITQLEQLIMKEKTDGKAQRHEMQLKLKETAKACAHGFISRLKKIRL